MEKGIIRKIEMFFSICDPIKGDCCPFLSLHRNIYKCNKIEESSKNTKDLFDKCPFPIEKDKGAYVRFLSSIGY